MGRVLANIYFGFYFLVFGSMIFSHRLLSQVRPAFVNFNRDLTELALLATGLPRWMIAHPGSFLLFDILLFALPLLWIVAGLRRWWIGVVFVFFLGLYLLLADIFWQVHLEPFVLYLLVPVALLMRRPERFDLVWRACRYYFLYVFISAAVWKIARGGVFNGEEMGRILLVHHAELLSGDCGGWLCRCYGWLIDRPLVAQLLYIAGVVVEGAFIVGMFTRRYDRWLIGLAVLFVVFDWWVMRIPYWTILLGCVTLWLDGRPRERAIVVYETTHHENLPALLDLCEMRFPRVVVFLKEVSFLNLSGSGAPAERWPSVEFVVQGAAESNRRFILRLFRFLRESRCSHLHLATLDNNLLLWALRLCAAPEVQVSLTVHEVNAFFSWPLGSLRDVTETVAKPLLRWRIRHYHFFLISISRRFIDRMPNSMPIFLPSRFYTSAAPEQRETDATDTRPFTIVIPGSVDANRRDYEPVLEVFQSWPAELPPVQLVLLGDSSGDFGRQLVAKLRALPALQLRSYEGYVPETVYEQEIRNADLLWSPLRKYKTGARDNPEVYGETTASGLTADILLNNIPALAPEELEMLDFFSAAILPYRNAEEAADLLRGIITDTVTRYQLRFLIHKAFSFVTKENFAVPFDGLTAFDQEGKKWGHHPIKPVDPHIQ